VRSLLLVLLALSILPVRAESRSWRSVNGNQSFRAEFMTSDGTRVTLKRSDNRIITFPVAKLHIDDRVWIANNTKTTKATAGRTQPAPEGTAFDALEFGDDRRAVQEKLMQSKIVTPTVAETLFGRTGLNGVFKTTSTIGGLHCFLYFDWTDDGKLREVTLQTQPVARSSYPTLLNSNWKELTTLLSALHGKPKQEAPFPDIGDLQDGLLLGSHLWHTEEKHSVLLCSGQERDQFLVAVRITSDYIAPTTPTPSGSGKTSRTSPSGFTPADFQP